ncbi:hypothetical protein INF35_12250 [Subdoligranulum sp. DSM 109015]|uniref:LPXTG-motif cell wall anchor domain-containing protein n=1 Tax=Gemmiger gallinarum TaxID=2779354 RepID=A0ABR9R706_9FIRM|nr:SpaA isopeptide-forming pilin-related protein [Gemmiger gallinarum]MBE5038560.1 hypothetical protein [Gemmiger gallinarum]
MKKRVLSVLLALCLAGSLASTAWAAGDQATPETAEADTSAVVLNEEEEQQDETTASQEETSGEESADQEEELQEDAASYPAKEFETTVESSDVTVSVSAPEGALPEDVTLTASLVGSSEDAADDQAVADVAAELDAAEVEYDGFVALDISFVDAGGAKVEPLQPVAVNFSLPSEMLPEDADPESLTVQHLAEDETGAVEAVETVADAADATDGTIAVDAAPAVLAAAPEEAPMPQDAEITAEFEVEGFSTFTLTWSARYANGTTKKDFTIHTYLENGTSLNAAPENFTVGVANEYIFTADNPTLEIPGYQIVRAEMVYELWEYEKEWWQWVGSWKLIDEGSSDVYSFNTSNNWDNGAWTYRYKTTESSQEQTITIDDERDNVYFNLYYRQVSPSPTSDLVIEDDISDTGSLRANYSKTLDPSKQYYYRWYQQAADGTYQEISGELNDTISVYEDGARETYMVRLYEVGNEIPIAESLPFQVPYYNQLQNGSFEDVKVQGESSNLQVTSGLYPEMVWQTTGLGANVNRPGLDIEIVNARASSAESNYGITSVPHGDQCAELNCEAAGALYQDVMTIPDRDLYWSASHRARGNRNGKDTMYVIIMDAAVAAENVTTQNDIDDIVNDVGQWHDNQATITKYNTQITIWRVQSGNDWTKIVNETYRVPEGQYLTRFFFGAGDVRSGDKTQGNLIDKVSFSQYRVPTEPGKGTIYIEKNVEGFEQNVTIPENTYTFTIYEDGTKLEDVTLPTEDAAPSNTAAWRVAVENLTSNTYKVVEQQPADSVKEYQYESTSTDVEGATTETRETKEFLLSQNTTVVVEFTNTYTPTTGTLAVTKQVEGWGDPNQMPSGSFKFKVYAGDATTGDPVETFALPDNSGATPVWTKELTLPAGSYTVVEKQPGQNGTYQYDSTQIAVDGEQASTGLQKTVSVVANETTNVTVTNKYKPYTGSLTIKKVVNGLTDSAAANNTQFRFTITGPETMFTGAETSKTFDAVNAAGAPAGGVTFNNGSDGTPTATVTITGEGSLKINGLPLGTYTVQETSAPDIGDFYCELPTSSQSSTISNAMEGQLDQTVTITNTYKPYLTLDITKSVTGEMGSSEDYFDFTLTGVDSDQYKLEQDQESEDANFKLNNGSTVTLTGLKPGDTVTISETTANGYTAQGITIAEGSALTEKAFSNQTTTSVTITIPEGNAANLGTVIFTNHREAVAPTGLESNHTTPYVLMITAAGIAGLALIGGIVVRRRRRRME